MQRLNLSLEEQSQKFRWLQEQLRDRWQSIEVLDNSDYDILVIPSVSLDQRELQKIKGFLHYEERLLFSLIRLQNPRTRVIYVTSQPLSPIVIEYYLQLLPGIPFSHARDRLVLFSTYDASATPLTEKIFMICYNSTNLERELSVQLNVPLLALDPDLLYWGTKSGSRQIFAECGVSFPDGSELVKSPQDLAEAAADLWERQPNLQRMVVKLNEGFSGEGNAILDLRPIEDKAPENTSHRVRVAAIGQRFSHLNFEAKGQL
jgi:hypothetical protein